MTAGVKLRRPETAAQAAHFQRLNGEALAAGFCNVCAPQFAYGRQHGWSAVKPPCAHCHPLAADQAPRWAYAHGGDR